MFGYVKPDKQTLLVREYEYYRAVYCGICAVMRRRTGRLSAVSLSYDIVFLALVRQLCTDEKATLRQGRCPTHPTRRRPMLAENPVLLYAARLSALLSYYKIKDDLHDKKGFARLGARLLLPVFARARKKASLPAPDALMASRLSELAALEAQKTASVDEPAHLFGTLLGALFAHELPPPYDRVCRELGYHLGKFIYAADAAEDYGKDIGSGSYNPYVQLYAGTPLTDSRRQSIHTALLLELEGMERAVNLLPLDRSQTLRHIIENTLYEGLPDRIKFLRPAATSADERTEHD
ncbi:MAG: DUF5685 family protein [Eubacteriales bacterium]